MSRIFTAILLLTLAGPMVACAQDDERRQYVPIPFDPDFEAAFKNRLLMEKQLGPLKDLVRQMVADPNKLPLDPNQFKDIKFDDPEFKKALQDWAADDPKLQQALKDWLKNNPADKQPDAMKKLHDNLKQLADQPTKKIAIPVHPKDFKQPPPVAPPEPRKDAMPRAIENAMKKAQDGKFGDWLKESPVWQRALTDLTSLDKPNGPGLDLNDLENRFPWFDGDKLAFGENALERLRNMPQPNFERFRWDRPIPGIGNVRAPDLPMPGRLPDFGSPSLPTLGAGVSWLLFILLLGLVGWQLMRWARKQPSDVGVDSMRTSLGPWPIQPDVVATRAELVLAFDYLALLTLGMPAQFWNHRVVASQWSENTPSCTELARALANLYEAARYTIGNATLSDAERTQARQALTQIAEAL